MTKQEMIWRYLRESRRAMSSMDIAKHFDADHEFIRKGLYSLIKLGICTREGKDRRYVYQVPKGAKYNGQSYGGYRETGWRKVERSSKGYDTTPTELEKCWPSQVSAQKFVKLTATGTLHVCMAENEETEAA